MGSRHTTSIRREGWYYLVITAVVIGGAVFKEVNLLIVLGGMLLGSALLSWRMVAANLRGLAVVRKLPLTLSAGDPLTVRLTLTNPRRRLGAWAVVVEEDVRRLTRGGDGQSLAVQSLFPYVAAGQSANGGYRGRLTERGRYAIGPIRLSTSFPFGLFSRTIVLGQTDTLIVLPRLGRLVDGWATRRLEALVGTERRNSRPGNEGDFYGLREWHAGDARRMIHWRSSARLGKPVVRQFERPRNSDAAVVLDLWQPTAPSADQLDSVELAVSFAATLLSDLCRKGGGGVFLALNNGAPECIGGPGSSALLQRMMERLATAQAATDDFLPRVLQEALRQIPAGTEIIVVATRPTQLSDTERFATIDGAGLALSELLRRVRCVDTSHETLSQVFCPE